MKLCISTISRVMLASLAAVIFLSGNVSAEEAKPSIQPQPETQATSSHCPHCQQGMTAYGYCEHCRGGMGRFNGGDRPDRLAPGTGWCAPTKVPYTRERVQYWKYYPNYWSGYGPGPATPYYPMVYTPTDTTQLGFYYQHAPSWYAQPWRVPGPPHPAYWHNRYCGRHGGGKTQGYCPSCQPNYYGYTGYQTPVTPVDEVTPTPAAVPVAPQQAPQTFLPPPPSFQRTPVLSVLPDAPPEV